ncbi:MAG: FG-GAP-like repeat-containing protein [Candidatus Aminicenantes bacterium]|jgi:hypothetical protein
MTFPGRIKHVLSFLSLVILPCFMGGTIHFTDVTQVYGVRGYNYYGGHGVSWIDVNGDGLLDIYVKNVAGSIYDVPNNLFINYGSFFVEEAAARGVTDAYGFGTHGAVFADYDNDKDFDLFSTTTYGYTTAHNHLYRNDGTGFFTDVTSHLQPAQTENVEPRGVAAADFNKDGYIDFYFSNPVDNTDPSRIFPPTHKNNFYMNNGDGTFFAEHRGIDWIGFTQGVSAVDVDGDGDIDLAEARWKPPSTIYLNDGTGRFQDAGAALGLPQIEGKRDNGMTFGDLNTNGRLDLAVVGAGRVRLYRQVLSGRFNWYQTIDLTRSPEPFHACFGDFDHDGDLDLYVSGEHVYENDGTGLFTRILENISGLLPSLNMLDPRGSALGDFDNDGDLDIYVADADSFNVLLRNDLNDSNWIQVKVTDNTKGVGGFGTKLDLYQAGHVDDPQFLRGHRQIQGEYGYVGQDMPTVHFGAPSSLLYDLKITFLDGKTKVVENVHTGQKIQVRYSFIYPPLNLQAQVIQNNALFYREHLIVLSWQANPENVDIQKYRVYAVESGKRTLLSEVDAATLSYTLRHVDETKTYQFEVAAVDSSNEEGDAATVTVGGGTSSPPIFLRRFFSSLNRRD